MTGWIADFFRLGWGALYWNTRKSWHALRGRRRRSPCQAHSDSGRAHETGCDAVLHYSSPARFRHVCPLLVPGPNGTWVCSVNTDQVRPFWGRAIALLGGGTLLAGLLASLAAFFFLRGVGYEVAYRQIIWPPAWSEFRGIQATYYIKQARADHAAGRLSDALLALSNAYELNPRDYPAGLLLAQLWQAGQPVLSDNLYARLLADHPDQREKTSQSWYRALLARGDFRAIQRLSGERILATAGPAAAPAAAWVQALLFATRQLAESEALALLLADPRLPPALRPLIQLELDLYTQSPEERAQRLRAAASASLDPFTTFHLLNRLLEENRPDLVLPFATAAGPGLGDREKVRLRLDCLARLGLEAERTALITALLARPVHPAICELLSAHLASYPDASLLRLFAAKLASDPLPAGDAVYPQSLAFFAACGATGDATLIRDAAARLSSTSGKDSRALAAVTTVFLQPGPDFRLESFLPVLQPLPLDVTYALYQRYHPPPPYAPAPQPEPSRRHAP